MTIIVTQGVLGYCLIQPLLCAATFACLRLAPGALPLSQLPVKARFLSIGTVKRSVTIEDSWNIKCSIDTSPLDIVPAIGHAGLTARWQDAASRSLNSDFYSKCLLCTSNWKGISLCTQDRVSFEKFRGPKIMKRKRCTPKTATQLVIAMVWLFFSSADIPHGSYRVSSYRYVWTETAYQILLPHAMITRSLTGSLRPLCLPPPRTLLLLRFFIYFFAPVPHH